MWGMDSERSEPKPEEDPRTRVVIGRVETLKVADPSAPEEEGAPPPPFAVFTKKRGSRRLEPEPTKHHTFVLTPTKGPQALVFVANQKIRVDFLSGKGAEHRLEVSARDGSITPVDRKPTSRDIYIIDEDQGLLLQLAEDRDNAEVMFRYLPARGAQHEKTIAHVRITFVDVDLPES